MDTHVSPNKTTRHDSPPGPLLMSVTSAEVLCHVQESVMALTRRACVTLPADELEADTPLLALGLDSLALMEIIFDLELHYDVQVDEARLLELETISDVIFMISAAVSDAGGTLPDGPPGPWAAEEV